WSNDLGGVTLGLRNRTNYLGRYERGMLLASVATGSGAAGRLGFYGRWSNPIRHLMPRTQSSVAAWDVEGRAGVALSVDRALRQHLGFGPDPHVGFDALWMATTDLAYVDRRLWDDAGTVEAGPWASIEMRRGATLLRARLGARGGIVYSNPGPGIVSSSRYDIEGFGRFTGAASMRTPFLIRTRRSPTRFSGAAVRCSYGRTSSTTLRATLTCAASGATWAGAGRCPRTSSSPALCGGATRVSCGRWRWRRSPIARSWTRSRSPPTRWDSASRCCSTRGWAS